MKVVWVVAWGSLQKVGGSEESEVEQGTGFEYLDGEALQSAGGVVLLTRLACVAGAGQGAGGALTHPPGNCPLSQPAVRKTGRPRVEADVVRVQPPDPAQARVEVVEEVGRPEAGQGQKATGEAPAAE
jgi:hypothetical protein